MACLALTGLATLAACGDDDSEDTSASAIPKEREGIIAEFPQDVRPLLTEDIPTPVLGALLRTRQQGPETLVWKDSGGELFEGEAAAFIEDWEKITGWSVKSASPLPSPGEVRAQVASGAPQWDVIEIGSLGEAELMEDEDLLDPIDTKLLQPILKQFPDGYEHSEHWIQYILTGVVMIWDTREWPMSGNHPESVSEDLFNTEEFPGKRCLFNFPAYGGTLEYPLLAAGADPEGLYPLDVDRALSELDKYRDDIVFWESGAESVQFIASGECQIGVTWHGRPALRMKEDPDLPLGISWKDSVLIDGAWAVPKGAKNREAANSLFAYALTPQNQCDFGNAVGYGVPLDESCLDEFGQRWVPTEENRAQTARKVDNDYYRENIDELIDTFNEWLTR